jgi:hypothetical protein
MTARDAPCNVHILKTDQFVIVNACNTTCRGGRRDT